MTAKLWLVSFCAIFAGPSLGQPTPDQVFLEVPMFLDAPGRQQMIRAWHDGEHFFVDAVMLLELLNFNVQLDQGRLTAMDDTKTIVLDFGLGQQLLPTKQSLAGMVLYADRRFLLSTAGLARVFGSDIDFDERRLLLRVSTAATLFDAGLLHQRRLLMHEAPGPLQYRRQRSLWGGLMINWQVHRQQGYALANVDVTSSLMAGTVRGRLGRNHMSISYAYDWPESKRLSQLEFGRFLEGLTGIRLSNRPLAPRLVQRIETVAGQATPYARIDAQISGHTVDQVRANAEGLYQLQVPIWYGTNVVDYVTHPMGGEQGRNYRRYYLTHRDLVAPGRLDYDVILGWWANQAVFRGMAHFGLARALTVHLGASRQLHDNWLEAGGIWNPMSFMTLSTSAKWPIGHYYTRVQAWHNGLSVDGNWHWRGSSDSDGQLNLTSLYGPLSLYISAYALRNTSDWRSNSITPSAWLALPHSLILRARLHYEQSTYGRNGTELRRDWHIGAGKQFSKLQAFFNVAGHGNRWSIGLDGFLSVRGWSFGFSTSVDTGSGRIAASLTLQANTPAALMAVRAHGAHQGYSHSQSLYGQVQVDQGVTVGRNMHQESAARLIIFKDLNSNGQQDSGEPLLTHFRAQLYNAHWSREADGTLYASHLEPFGIYQVRIIEASVHDPNLQPLYGYTFSFRADPGRTKRLYVPMQPKLQVPGRILDLDRAPSRLIVQTEDGVQAPVYRDGGFTLVVSAGQHQIIVSDVLTKEVLTVREVSINQETSEVTVSLNKTQE